MANANGKKVTEQGIGYPEPVETRSERAGSPRPSSSYRSAPPAGNQADVQINTTGIKPRRNIKNIDISVEDIEKNVNKSHRVHSRLNAVSQLKRCDSLNTKKKRKVSEIQPEELSLESHIIKKKEDPVAFVLMEALELIAKCSRDLNKLIEDSPTTKKEIKETSAKLKKAAEVVGRKSTKEWLEARKWGHIDMPKYDVECQANMRINRMDTGVQTAPWRMNAVNNLDLDYANSLAKWKEIETLKWNDEVFRNTQVKFGNPLVAHDTTTKVILVEPEDPNMENSIQKMFRDRYPELVNLNEEFGLLEEITKVGPKQVCRKVIKATHNGTDEDIWNKLIRIREGTASGETIAIHQLKCMTVPRLRKMVECIFHKKGKKSLFTPIVKIMNRRLI